MELEMRENKEDRKSFVISDITPAFMNSIRRVILQEVPVMAIDDVEISANDTVMGDEVLAHRLGQMPIKTPEGYLLPSECGCREGRCSNCSVELDLDMEGACVVRASDLETSDSEAGPVQGDAPIVRLGEDQKLKLTAIARLGVGKDHANWQPAVASYKYMPVIDIDQDARDDWSPCVEACPEDILVEEDGELKVTDVEKCTLCRACTEACSEAIEVEGDPTKFIFYVESTGSMPPERIIKDALEVLEEKCSEFSEKVEAL